MRSSAGDCTPSVNGATTQSVTHLTAGTAEHLDRMIKAFDPARLIDIFDGNGKAIREVIEETLSTMRNIIAGLSAEIGADARAKCTALIHELKGLSGNVGAQEMYVLSKDIEARLRDSSHELNRQWFAELARPYDRFVARVNEYLTERPSP